MAKASSENNFLYNKNLKSKTRGLVLNMTKSEACFWKYAFSDRRMEVFQFRRQRPIWNFIVNLICKELLLIIEVDGITHSYETTSIYDDARQKVPETIGFKVMRFTDEELLTDINGVRGLIEDWIDINYKKPPP